MAQSGRIRVQASRSAKGQLKGRTLRVLQKKQRMLQLEPIRADPVDPPAPGRVREGVGMANGLLTWGVLDP